MDVQNVGGDIFHLSGNVLSQMSQVIFFFFFFDSCFLFAVAMAKDGEVLPTVFTFL